jgi:hypothetical protein
VALPTHMGAKDACYEPRRFDGSDVVSVTDKEASGGMGSASVPTTFYELYGLTGWRQRDGSVPRTALARA